MISHHNLAFFLDTMRRVREAIRGSRFQAFRKEYLERLAENDAPSV
jgi:tRNA-guanine family transglycosylase